MDKASLQALFTERWILRGIRTDPVARQEAITFKPGQNFRGWRINFADFPSDYHTGES
jgi:hypothetical protein